jgi:hypothetical protein
MISVLEDVEWIDDGQDDFFRLGEAVLQHILRGPVHELSVYRSDNRSDNQIGHAGLFPPTLNKIFGAGKWGSRKMGTF